MSERPKRKRPGLRRFNRAVLVALGLLVALVTVAIWIANPSRPDPPELQKIDLKVPKAPPAAAALLRLLERKDPAVFSDEEPTAKAGLEAMKQGRWLADPAAVIVALDGLKDPSLTEVRTALLAPGCLPREMPAPDKDYRYSFLPLIRGVRLLTLRSVATAQQGDTAGAARGAFEILDRLLELEQRCAPSLIEAMVLTATVRVVARALGFQLAAGLEPGLEKELWDRLGRLERRKSPVPDALRQEAGWLLETLPQAIRSAPSKGGEPPRSWPWYDEGDTRRLFELTYRRLVWLAEQPLGSKAWTRRFPEEEYLERTQNQPGWLALFRFNAIGKILAGIAAPAFRKYPLKWHQDRCAIAALRARWLHDLKARGRQPAAEMASPRDPFSGQPFVVLPDHNTFCAVPSAMLAGELKGSEPLPLPPPLSAKAPE